MEKTKPTTPAEAEKKTAVATTADGVRYHCTVTAAGAKKPIAGLICAAGKKLKLTEEKAKAAEKMGWVTMDGIV